jgi:type VI secretion system protein ImpH
MASSRRSAKHIVSQRLRSEPYRFSFVQAVRLLEQIGRSDTPPRQAVGGNALPFEECVRLVASPTLSFPSTEVMSLKLDDHQATQRLFGVSSKAASSKAASSNAASSESTTSNMVDAEQMTVDSPGHLPPALVVGFMGMFGPSGVLPQHDTQRIINIGSKKNPERDFLDIFNHRILSYFYRASIKYRMPVAYETAYRKSPASEHLASRILYSLAGMGTPGLQQRLLCKNEFAIEFGGLLRHQPKNGVSLRRMLTAYFGLPFKLIQFVGQWLTLSDDNRSHMASAQYPLGQNCQLGTSFIIGDRIWDVTGKFRLRIGPLNQTQFESFLPGSRNLTELSQIVRWYVGPQFDFDIQLELMGDAVPEITLGSPGNTQLGFNSWLISATPADNKLEAVFVQDGLPLNAPTQHAA